MLKRWMRQRAVVETTGRDFVIAGVGRVDETVFAGRHQRNAGFERRPDDGRLSPK
jgi:hypothetical protein